MQDKSENRYHWLTFLVDPRWIQVIAQGWQLGRKILRGLANEGIYEVLDYECRLELKDTTGNLAKIQKREKIRYLQDYITSYQDQAWGDGEILLNYRCSPGTPVDGYRLGHKTYKLISLREFRNKGDIDEFHIEWNMRHGFLKSTGFWGTAINHRTKKVTIKLVFPKDRPPLQVSITESNLRKTHDLGKEAQQLLPDGRSIVVWENTKLRLYEDYVLRWEW
jgi:hypothetical protein